MFVPGLDLVNLIYADLISVWNDFVYLAFGKSEVNFFQGVKTTLFKLSVILKKNSEFFSRNK